MAKNWAEALVDFVDDGHTTTSKRARFLASFYGSLLLHLSVLVSGAARASSVPNAALIWPALVIGVLLSLLFGFIISTGTKGGLIRRFWYGISLPALCYYLAFTVIPIPS